MTHAAPLFAMEAALKALADQNLILTRFSKSIAPAKQKRNKICEYEDIIRGH